MKRLLVVAAFVAVLVLSVASGAFAGEVKGPPTGPDPNTNLNTAATSHANSFCVFSGLNDFDYSDPNGQTTKQTQTPADGPPGAPGLGVIVDTPDGPLTISCKGGSNLDNPNP